MGKEGVFCRDGRECKSGLLCGSSKHCVQSAEGQRCLSNYWWPMGYLCSKKTNKCTRGFVVPSDRFPAVSHAKKCTAVTDCGAAEACFNGVCLPRHLGWTCTGTLGTPPGTMCEGAVTIERTEGRKCRDSWTCVPGLTCRDFRMCSQTKLGDHCDGNTNCVTPMKCSNARCVCPGRG